MTVDHMTGSNQNQWMSLEEVNSASRNSDSEGSKPSEGSHEDKNGVVCKMEEANGEVNGKLLDLALHDAQISPKLPPLASMNGESDDEERRQEESEAEEDVRCGLGVLSPRWMQIFASKQAFLVTFCITWVLQGMYYTYFVSVITTIEKLFRIQSKTTGIIMSATEIGQIGSSLLLTYYGGQGHRPKWIAWGMVLFAVSSFTCSLPHFIFREQLIPPHDTIYSGNPNKVDFSYHVPNLCLSGHSDSSPLLKRSVDHDTRISSLMHPFESHARGNASDARDASEYARLTTDNGDIPECEDDVLQEQEAQSKITQIVLAIFFISLLGVGMGQTAVYTLGIPYIDDNVATRESPLYFAITIGVRILGPAMGFILGSLCTSLYADLSVKPQFGPKDPRWVGAWWLGLVMVSAMLILTSLAMFSFPKRLKGSKGRLPSRKFVVKSKNPSLKDFPKAVKRLLKNDILMFRTASSVLHILPIAGLYTFLPKYLETQFKLAAYSANMISGVGGILVMGLGIIISGVFILRVKPNARFVAAWIAFTAVVYAIGMGVLMLIGCPMVDIYGLESSHTGQTDFTPACNATCNCDKEKFSPVCGEDNRNYFSACHAGCRKSIFSEDNTTISEFFDCLCIDVDNTTTSTQSPHNATTPVSVAKIGYCDLQCSNFVPYILLFSMFVFIHSTSEVGSMLLILRCVDPRDKAMALGLIQFAIGLFGNVPCPIVYGAVVDYACLVWDKTCGKQGACWLYDTDVFRTFYHGTTGAILLCAFFVDIVVWYKAGSINFVDEQLPEQSEELSPIKQRSETSV